MNQSFADMIISTFREGMPGEIYNVIKNINRPENCHALKKTQVNAGVWSVLKPQTQTVDSKMRGIQNAVCKAGSNLAKLLDKGSNLDKEMKEWGSTALAILGKANIWINTRRRESHTRICVYETLCPQPLVLLFCGRKTKALIDSGSQVTTVSEDCLHTLSYTPDTVHIDDLILKRPDGNSLPYKGCIVATIQAEFLCDKEITVLAVVVP